MGAHRHCKASRETRRFWFLPASASCFDNGWPKAGDRFLPAFVRCKSFDVGIVALFPDVDLLDLSGDAAIDKFAVSSATGA